MKIRWLILMAYNENKNFPRFIWDLGNRYDMKCQHHRNQRTKMHWTYFFVESFVVNIFMQSNGTFCGFLFPRLLKTRRWYFLKVFLKGPYFYYSGPYILQYNRHGPWLGRIFFRFSWIMNREEVHVHATFHGFLGNHIYVHATFMTVTWTLMSI